MVEAQSDVIPQGRLGEHRIAWRLKPILREIYRGYYREMLARCRLGTLLEIGGGSGNLKEFAPAAISTDVVFAPWLDALADAHRLPFAAERFDSIVLFDVLHHLERPKLFLHEAARVLRPGGRVVMVEPAITPISSVFYRLFHPEPVDMTADPLEDGSISAARDPFAANQAIPTLLFGMHRERLENEVPALRLIERRLIAPLSYPLSGGFRRWSLLPLCFASPLLKLERALEPVIGPIMAFRLIATLEKSRPR